MLASLCRKVTFQDPGQHPWGLYHLFQQNRYMEHVVVQMLLMPFIPYPQLCWLHGWEVGSATSGLASWSPQPILRRDPFLPKPREADGYIRTPVHKSRCFFLNGPLRAATITKDLFLERFSFSASMKRAMFLHSSRLSCSEDNRDYSLALP